MSDLRIDGNAKGLLRSTIGETLIKLRHDPFTTTPSFTAQGELFFEGKILRIRSEETLADFFEAGKEEISALFIDEIREEDAVSAFIGIEQIDSPIGKKVKDVWVVDEEIQEFSKGEPGEIYCLTRGIIFVLEERQLAFEKGIWLSEEVFLNEGTDVLEEFKKLGTDLDGWPKGCMSKNGRIAYSLLDGRGVAEEANETGEDPFAE